MVYFAVFVSAACSKISQLVSNYLGIEIVYPPASQCLQLLLECFVQSHHPNWVINYIDIPTLVSNHVSEFLQSLPILE